MSSLEAVGLNARCLEQIIRVGSNLPTLLIWVGRDMPTLFEVWNLMYEYAHIKHIKSSIQSASLLIDEEFSEQAKSKCCLVFNLFIESLESLHWRYKSVLDAESAFNSTNEDTTESYTGYQLTLVRQTEAFHQHVYAVLGRFAMLLNHIAPKEFKTALPTRSISKMLDYLESKVEAEGDLNFNLIRNSLEFRSKFVDHPQQHKAHDWMTYRIPTSPVAIIYYVPGSNTRAMSKGALDPHDESFQPPLNCDSFYVAPPIEKVYGAILSLFQTFGSQLNKLI